MSAIAEASLDLWMVIAKLARPRESRRIIVSVDGQAPRIRRPCDDREAQTIGVDPKLGLTILSLEFK